MRTGQLQPAGKELSGHYVFDVTSERGGILLLRRQGLTISNLSLETRGEQQHQEAALYLKDCEDVVIKDSVIWVYGSGSAISLQGCRNVRIERCLLVTPVDGELRRNQTLKAWGQLPENQKNAWVSRKEIVRAPDPCTNVTIKDCVIWGGYYGIGVSSSDMVQIVGCKVLNNVRGISVQDGSSQVNISGCMVRDNISAGIHYAFGSRASICEDNQVSSGRAEGEGFIQAYVGCQDITFRNNQLEALGAGPKYFMYCGVASSGITFEGNRIQGASRRAPVAVEAVWDTRIQDPAHRNYHAREADNNHSHGDVTCTLRGNRFSGKVLLTQSRQHRVNLTSDVKDFKDITWQQ